MGTDTVIRVEKLSKKYLIRRTHSRSQGDGLRHVISDALARPFRYCSTKLQACGFARGNRVGPSGSAAPPSASGDREEFSALRDVSFEVKKGEVLGIIGGNGAGKSTLLKILSRITEPTSGRIGIKGCVASLLEVGTGFHAELSGRENIYLNGAILGMTRGEVKRKFEEIVDFAGVERFLDTPVKHYSSGMYVRLAFAVAAHLEPEILIVDEVLAVGDIEFQRKCLGKMRGIAGMGRTILFVSHNLHAVQALCHTALVLKSGEIIDYGGAGEVSQRYLAEANASQQGTVHIACRDLALRHTVVRYREVSDDHAELSIEVTLVSARPLDGIFVDVAIDSMDEARIVQFVPKSYHPPLAVEALQEVQIVYRATVPFLRPGPYSLTVYAHLQSGPVMLHVSGIPAFNVAGTSLRPEVFQEGFSALMVPRFSLDVKTIESCRV